MEQKENIRAYLAWISVCIVWGTTYLAIRIGVHDLPPMLFAGFRWILAGLLLFIPLRIKKYKLPDKREFFHAAIVGIMLLGFGNGLVVVGEQWVPSSLAALLITTTPFWIVGIESFLPGGTRMNARIIIGLLAGLAGVVLIFGGDLSQLFEPSYLTGVVALLFAVLIWAIGSLYSKYRKVSIHPLMSAAVQMLTAGTLMGLLGFILGEHSELHITTNGFWAFFYLVFVGSLLGYVSYIYAISHLPISLVSTYAYINPIIAIFLGWLILNEPLNIFIFIASIIILAGVYMVKSGTEQSQKRKFTKKEPVKI